MSIRFDAIIIGTGQAGPTLAKRLTGAGMKVAIIERKRFGGTCINNGCIPTKALVASAKAIHMARHATDYGFNTDGVTVDMKKIKERKDAIVASFSQNLESWLRAMERCTVYQGHAQLESARAVRVGGDVLEAEKIFLNVGARASKLPIPGLNNVGYLTNSGMMNVDFLPPHLIILGGSYVG